ncbi:putative polyprotein [Panicum miliaceum]|uniref:Polyprotein n=1 Tax=Panicum miliaceum TaxID=4540 RepID=A0A3L6SCT7_PANMI|nr:putative polyprotein [Panicum miliaceum]
MKQLNNHKQTGSVTGYYTKFEQLAHRILLYNNACDDAYFVTRFLGGSRKKFVHPLLYTDPKTWILRVLWHCCRKKRWNRLAASLLSGPTLGTSANLVVGDSRLVKNLKLHPSRMILKLSSVLPLMRSGLP